MAFPSVSSILDGIANSRAAFEKNEAGSRESLIDQSRALITALEIPSEFIQRTFWAEVRSCKIVGSLFCFTKLIGVYDSRLKAP